MLFFQSNLEKGSIQIPDTYSDFGLDPATYKTNMDPKHNILIWIHSQRKKYVSRLC